MGRFFVSSGKIGWKNLIRLNADGTMNLRAEDGSWLDYTYTMDATHFYFTYSATGGTYIVFGDTLIVSPENKENRLLRKRFESEGIL